MILSVGVSLKVGFPSMLSRNSFTLASKAGRFVNENWNWRLDPVYVHT